jgi:hypothetical protein
MKHELVRRWKGGEVSEVIEIPCGKFVARDTAPVLLSV